MEKCEVDNKMKIRKEKKISLISYCTQNLVASRYDVDWNKRSSWQNVSLDNIVFETMLVLYDVNFIQYILNATDAVHGAVHFVYRNQNK